MTSEAINPSDTERGTDLMEVEMSELEIAKIDEDNIQEFGVEIIKHNELDSLTWFMHRSIIVKRRTLI